jgi:hypothetical protein
MLAMADQDGLVLASVGGLAHRARVTKEECEDAIKRFLGPDDDSRDGTTGERIEKVVGGWLILNHSNYRDRQTRQQALTAARVAKHREKVAKERSDERYVTPGNATSPDISEHLTLTAYASASESASVTQKGEPEREKLSRTEKAEHDPQFVAFWNAYDRKVAKPHAVKAWLKIAPDEALAAEIIKAAADYARSNPDAEFRKHPATWLNARCWEDQPARASPRGGGGFDRSGRWTGVPRVQSLDDYRGTRPCDENGVPIL